MRRHVCLVNVTLAGLALFVFASTFTGGRWGAHWCFVAAYAAIGLYCAWKQSWIGLATCASLIVLRIDLAQHTGGWQLKLASTAFVVLLALLCRDARPGDAP